MDDRADWSARERIAAALYEHDHPEPRVLWPPHASPRKAENYRRRADAALAARLPFGMDQRAQAAVLADLPPAVAQEAGEFYENAGAGQRKPLKKREAMAVAWAHVLRPYLIGLRDRSDFQARPATLYPAGLDDRDLCECRIGQCRALTERCREDADDQPR